MARYTFNTVEYPGYSTINDQLAKPALIGWAASTAVDYCKEHKDDADVFENAKKEWREAGKKAMDIGSEIHHLIEQYLKDGKDVDFTEKRPEVVQGFTAFLKWDNENGCEWLETEKPVVSEDYGYAGTLDAICKFTKGKLAGKIYVIDFKSSKAIYPEYATQIIAYAQARTECNGRSYDLTFKETIEVNGQKEEKVSEYTVEYPVVEIDGVAILRLDKTTGLPEFKDMSKNYDTKLRAFLQLVKFYYFDKKRRLKNNAFVKEAW